jgi:hypothetical protein
LSRACLRLSSLNRPPKTAENVMLAMWSVQLENLYRPIWVSPGVKEELEVPSCLQVRKRSSWRTSNPLGEAF